MAAIYLFVVQKMQQKCADLRSYAVQLNAPCNSKQSQLDVVLNSNFTVTFTHTMFRFFSCSRTHGTRLGSVSQIIRRHAGGQAFGNPDFKPLVDCNPGVEDHWQDPNYPSEPNALQKFLKEQKKKFNDIKLPPRDPEETVQEYSDRCDKLRKEYLHSNPPQVSDEDVKAVFTEWYLRKLEENKWNHFVNQMISTRYSKPYDWDGTDPIPDWTALHSYPTDPSRLNSMRPTQTGRGMWNQDRHLREITAEGNTSIGDFEVEYATSRANKFADDARPPYLPKQLQTLNEQRSKGWQNLSGALPEFFNHSQLVRSDYQLDDEQIPWVPPNYYDPHIPLPAYRNHEALLTADPRNPKYIPKGE